MYFCYRLRKVFGETENFYVTPVYSNNKFRVLVMKGSCLKYSLRNSTLDYTLLKD